MGRIGKIKVNAKKKAEGSARTKDSAKEASGSTTTLAEALAASAVGRPHPALAARREGQVGTSRKGRGGPPLPSPSPSSAPPLGDGATRRSLRRRRCKSSNLIN